jgi:hypothetical protein
MSGYLQRLVSTAMGTDSSVHPLVKPVFSPPASPDEPALSSNGGNLKFGSTSRHADGVPLEISTEFAAVSTEASAPVDVSRQANGEQPDFSETKLNDIAQKLPQPATTVTVTNYQPLLTSNGPPPTLQPATRSAEPALLPAQPFTKRTQREQSRAPTANSPVYVPLLNTTPIPSRSETIETETPAYSGARMSQQKGRQWPAPAATNDSDEIQIHIGRIEVTAVSPPVATPTPKRAAKGPSLQEYLKRGRSR